MLPPSVPLDRQGRPVRGPADCPLQHRPHRHGGPVCNSVAVRLFPQYGESPTCAGVVVPPDLDGAIWAAGGEAGGRQDSVGAQSRVSATSHISLVTWQVVLLANTAGKSKMDKNKILKVVSSWGGSSRQ